MISAPFTAEEKADLELLNISELLDVNLVKNFIRLFPPQDNALYLGIKFIDSKYPKKWLTKSRVENVAGLVHRNRPKNITEIGEETYLPKSKNGIYVKPNGWKNKTVNTPYRQYGIPPVSLNDDPTHRYTENDKEIYPQWWPDYNDEETQIIDRTAAIERDKSKHKHHHHIINTSNQISRSIQTIDRESVGIQADSSDIYNNTRRRGRSSSIPINLSKTLGRNNNNIKPPPPSSSSPQQQHSNNYYDYNRDYYYYRNQPPPPPPSNIPPYYMAPPPPPPPPPSYYQPEYYYPPSSSQVPPLPLPPPQPIPQSQPLYSDYPYYEELHNYPPYDYKHVTIDEPIDMIINHPKNSSKLLKRCATPYPYPRRKYDDDGNAIDIAL